MLRFSDLELFVTVVREGSFSAAARSLRVSQPAVSARVSFLEEELATTLVLREGRRLRLTPTGQILYEYGLNMLQELESIRQRIQEETKRPAGPLLLCAGEASGAVLAPLLLGSFKKRFPDVRPKLKINPVAVTLADVLENRAGLGIMPYIPDEPRIEALEIAQDELCLIVPPDHPLADQGPVEPAALLEHPVLTRDAGTRTNALLRRALDEVGIKFSQLNIAMELGTNEALKTAVAAGMGIAFVARMSLVGSRAADYRIVPVKGLNLSRRYCLIRLANGSPTYVERRFWEHCQSEQMLKQVEAWLRH